MRKGIIILFIILFDVLFIYGINYTNRVMENSGFMIFLNKHDEEKIDSHEEDEEILAVTGFNGENIDSISKKINKFFSKTPLENEGETLARESIIKGVNPYLVSGIIMESTNCKVDCSALIKQCNNVSGQKGSPGCFGGSYKKYSNLDESIKDLVNIISINYESERQLPYKMYQSFGKNTTWAYKVNKYMDEVKRG